jgi:hypothetical protein
MKEKTLSQHIIGYIIGVFMVGLILYWYNHVLFIKQIGYWKCCILAVPFSLAAYAAPWIKYLYSALFIFVFFCQVLKWIDVISLPVFKM